MFSFNLCQGVYGRLSSILFPNCIETFAFLLTGEMNSFEYACITSTFLYAFTLVFYMSSTEVCNHRRRPSHPFIGG